MTIDVSKKPKEQKDSENKRVTLAQAIKRVEEQRRLREQEARKTKAAEG